MISAVPVGVYTKRIDRAKGGPGMRTGSGLLLGCSGEQTLVETTGASSGKGEDSHSTTQPRLVWMY